MLRKNKTSFNISALENNESYQPAYCHGIKHHQKSPSPGKTSDVPTLSFLH